MKIFFLYLGSMAVTGGLLGSATFWAARDTGVDAHPPALAVASTIPADQSLGADSRATIRMAFTRPLDPASVGETDLHVFGRWSGPHEGSLALAAQGTELHFTPDRPFHPGEWVTVTLSSNTRDTGGQPLEHGIQWGFWIQAGPGNWAFEEIGRMNLA